MKKMIGFVVAAALLSLNSTANAAAPFTLKSKTFADGAILPTKFGGNVPGNANCLGTNASPQLSWSNVPEGTKSLVFFMVDPEGRLGAGVNHWVAYGVPPARGSFAKDEIAQAPVGFVGGKSTQGLNHYMGPCTPPNTTYHHYVFVVIATDLEPDALPAGLTREEILPKLAGHGKGVSGLVARFKHPD